MFRNAVLTGYRSIRRTPLTSFINIGGLAIGLAVCLLTFVYVKREFSWDSWVTNASEIYGVEAWYKFERSEGYFSDMMAPLKVALDEEAPDIALSTRVNRQFWTARKGTALFYESVYAVDPEFLQIFPLEMTAGGRETALADVNSVVLSEATARKYFGSVAPIGETLTLNGKDYSVSAVYRDIPEDSTLPMKLFIRFDETLSPYFTHWSSTNSLIFVTLKPGVRMASVDNSLRDIINKYRPFSGDDDEGDLTENLRFFLQPFADIHLKSAGRSTQNPYGNLAFVWGYIAIALLVLGISCANYINLSTAQALRRAREVCLRKVAGANRRQLIVQFLGETMFVSLIALIIAVGLVELTLPWFEKIVGGTLNLSFVDDLGIWGVLFALVAITGIAAGGYPALYVSRFRPARFIHSNQSGAAGSARLRNALVFIQFAIAIGLIVMATVVYAQVRFAAESDLGFDRRNLIVLRGTNTPDNVAQSDTVRNEMLAIPGVEAVTRSYNIPTDGRTSTRTARVNTLRDGEWPDIQIMPSDHNFLETLGVQLIAGRYLSEDFATDTLVSNDDIAIENAPEANAVINLTAVQRLNFGTPEQALGQTVRMSMSFGDGTALFRIVGVVADFHFQSLRNEINPMIFYRQTRRFDVMTLRLREGALPDVLGDIDAAWQRVLPEKPIRRQFLTELFERRFAADRQKMNLFLGLSAVAVVLSCLGLLGLGAFSAASRTREIGIRKVMGANVPHIVWLLTAQFSRPVLLANIISWPIAWYFTDQWLQSFAYRIEVGPTYFIGAGLAALVIGWLTVGGHAYLAARTHPAMALRHE